MLHCIFIDSFILPSLNRVMYLRSFFLFLSLLIVFYSNSYGQTDIPIVKDKKKIWRRFKKRMKKIVTFTVPIYIVIFIMNRLQFFSQLEELLAGYLDFIPWLSPQAMGIIALHLAAELTAGLAAAGALLQDGVLGYDEIVLALLVGRTKTFNQVRSAVR